MNQAYLVARNLTRRKLRTFLLWLAIFIAFLLFGVLKSFERGFYSAQRTASADRMVTVNRVNFTLPLPVSYAGRIAAIDGVSAVTYQNWFGGYYQDPREPLIMFAAEPASYLAVYPDLVVDAGQRRAWLADRAGLAVGRVIANKYHWKLGDHVPIQSNIYTRTNGSHTWDFTVSVIFDSPGERARENQVIMRHDYFDESVTFGRDTVNMIMFTTRDSHQADAIAKRVDAMFANSGDETTTDTAAAFNRAFTAQLGNIALIISLVVATAFAAILLIVGNTLVMAVRERTREIGVLKTLGFQGPAILGQILAESLLLSLLGALAGLGTAALILKLLDEKLVAFVGSLLMSWPVFLSGLGWAVLLGLVTGAIPAWTGMRLRIVTALGRR
jgi:putative ABC transport system permease protein